jgi:hypothetical protein
VSATISACVIARDEEARLPDCLASLNFCDEVVVVDSGSVDRTRELAAAAGAKVVENPWPGFAVQRNVAIDHANGDWVLEVDADERVSPQLAAEIQAFLAAPPAAMRMGAIPLRDIFLGGPIGPAVRYPRYRHRLFRRGAFRHDESRSVHEGLWPDGPVQPFAGELVHLLAASWGEALRDAHAYARLEGEQHSRPKATEAVVGVLLRPLVKLLYRVWLYGGWRDGWRGIAKVWLECAADSLGTLYRFRHGVAGATSGFGLEPPRAGAVRIIGIALGSRGADHLAPWLERAAEAGADVALVGAQPPGGTSVRHRALSGGRPGALARAVDAEDQLRPLDALLIAGRRERLALRLLPSALRGTAPPLSPEASPLEATAALRLQSRSQEPA